MTLIKSISGIRGTIGGSPGNSLTPLDLVKFASAYAVWLKNQVTKERYKVIIGRDSRISGEMVARIVSGTLMGMGVDVTDLGPATTPTVEIAVQSEKADGGVILTASHNPLQWNALKLLNNKGEFLSADDGEELLKTAELEQFEYAEVDALGNYKRGENYNQRHIEAIKKLPLIDIESIKKRKFVVAVDCINSVGSLIVPELLYELGVEKVIKLNCNPDGKFAHNPEPLPENLTDLSKLVVSEKADLGFAVDPDVDRLAIVNEDGTMFGEEYTLVAIADYILGRTPGNTVSNLSSTKALGEITGRHGGKHTSSAVGEVNVITEMKKTGAIIGGEGNGGVIYPELHYGRDALVGIALFLTHLSVKEIKCSNLRKEYPGYHMSKNKFQLSEGQDTDAVLESIKKKYSSHPLNDIDGVKIDFENGWVHLRKSNTEPIIRIYSEGETPEIAEALAHSIMKEIETFSR